MSPMKIGKVLDNVQLITCKLYRFRHDILLILYLSTQLFVRLVPAGETEFAKDAVFGYQSSNLRDVKPSPEI